MASTSATGLDLGSRPVAAPVAIASGDASEDIAANVSADASELEAGAAGARVVAARVGVAGSARLSSQEAGVEKARAYVARAREQKAAAAARSTVAAEAEAEMPQLKFKPRSKSVPFYNVVGPSYNRAVCCFIFLAVIVIGVGAGLGVWVALNGVDDADATVTPSTQARGI